MATCPRCLGPLTEDHRCPRGRFSRVSDALSTVVVGAVVGGLLPVIFSADPPLALVLAAAALGAVLANAVRQAMGPHF
jgi:F0F1-type ATP synthase assembly protein I